MALRLDDFFDDNDDGVRKDDSRTDPARASDAAEAKQPGESGSSGFSDDDDFEDDFIVSGGQRRKRIYLKVGLSVVGLLVVVLVVRSLFFAPAASEGVMRGYVVSFEKSGIMFDSYEGVFVPDSPFDTASVRFSTTDQQVGRRIFQAMRTDSVIVLDYKRYNKSLPWRGSSSTIVTCAGTVATAPVSVSKPSIRRD